jgi:O-antigen ligase/tetratricopeptide (TPR) repeat protein
MRLFANIIRVTLLAVLLITPWWFGGVWARVQWVLMLVLAGLLAADLVGRFGEDDRPNLVPTAWLPVLAGLLLGLFQLVPWPTAMANVAAPTTVRWRADLATDPRPDGTAAPASAAAEDGGRGAVRRSVYPPATREYLALLTLALAVFILASIHLVDRQTVIWCLTSIAICGAALSFFGLVQRLSWNGKFYWVFEPLEGSFQSFGPFVNRNNAGGFLNLCLAAGLGLLVWVHWDPKSERYRWRSARESRPRRPGERRHPSDSPRVRSMRPEDEPPASRPADMPTIRGTESPPAASDPASPAEPAPELARAYHRSREREQREGSTESRRRIDRRHSGYSSASYPTSYRSASRSSMRLSVRRMREMADTYLADLNAHRLGGLALVVFIAGGVLCTASRGSVLALLAATAVTAMALLLRRGSRAYAAGLLVILLAGIGLMGWAGQTEFVRSRFEMMFQQSPYAHGRLPNWFDALQAVPQFPLAGSGLGTYPYVYERFQQRFLPGTVHRHAENQFIQAVVEGGLIALVLLLLVIVLTGMAIVQLFRAGGPVNLPLAVAGCFALTSQFVGGMFDFGLYIPSNTMLMAAICGIVIGRAGLLAVWPPEAFAALDRPASRHAYSTRSAASLPPVAHRPLMDDRLTVGGVARARHDSRARRPPRWNRLAASALTAPPVFVTLLIGLLMVGCLFASLEMNRAGRIEAAVRRANLARLLEQNIPENFFRASVPLQTVLPQRWDDAEAHQHLALLLMAQYQSETYHRLLAQAPPPPQAQPAGAHHAAGDGPDAPPEPLDAELWSRATVQHLHGTLRRLEQEGQVAEAERLIGSERVQQLLLPAVRHLVAARFNAPTISRVHYRLAELSAVAPGLGDEQAHLQRAQQLSPGDATLWFWSGLLHLNSGRVTDACANWRRSLELSRLDLDGIMVASQGRLTIRQLLEQTLPHEADLLLIVARQYFATEERAPYRHVFLERAATALQETELPRADAEYTQAAILNLQGRREEAARLYARAISLNSQNLNWRLEFAQMLIEMERFDEAHEHVNYLVTAQPNSAVYRKLQRDFNAKRWRVGVPKSSSSRIFHSMVSSTSASTRPNRSVLPRSGSDADRPA